MGSKIRKKPKKTQTSLEVTRGQIEVKGHSEAGRLDDYTGAIPNLIRHFVLKLLQKRYFLTQFDLGSHDRFV